MNDNAKEIEKSYKGLLATIFGVAHQKSDDEINRPMPDNTLDLTFDEIVFLRKKLREQERARQKKSLRIVKDI